MDVETTVEHISSLMEKFEPDTTDYLMWLNSFEYMAEVFKTKSEDYGRVLLGMLEPHVVMVLWRSIYPYHPFQRSYEELNYMLETFYGRFKGEEAIYYRFLTRKQYPNEPAPHYFSIMSKLFKKCSNKIQCMEKLKERFIEGLANEKTKILLQKHCEEITLGDAINIATSRETNITYVKKKLLHLHYL